MSSHTLQAPNSVADRVRKWSRIVHRVVAGSRGSSIKATVAWAWQARAKTAQPQLVENSSFTFVTVDSTHDTAVWIHNYWSDAYGIDVPHIRANLLDAAGRTVRLWSFDLPSDSTHRISIRAVCRDAGIEGRFEGELLLKVAHEKLFGGRPLQTFGEYLADDGGATGVHGQYGLVFKPFAHLVATMRAEVGDGRRTSVILTNPYAGPGGPASIRPIVELVSKTGRHRSKRVAALRPLSSRRVVLDSLFPNAAEFLGGETGHIRVQMPCPSSRMATMIDYPDGRTIVNHGADCRLLDQGPGIPWSWTDSHPVCSTMAMVDSRRDTVLTLVNNWGPVRDDYGVVVTIFDRSGFPVAKVDSVVSRDHLVQVSLRGVLERAGHELNPTFVGHAEVAVGRRPTGRSSRHDLPASYDVLLGFEDGGRLAAEVQVGGEIFNGPVPPGVRLVDSRRTRTFGRVRMGDRANTRIFLSHPSSCAGHDSMAAPVMTLIDCSGRRRATYEAEPIAPHGCALIEVGKAFPNWREVLGPTGEGVVRVRNLNARLYGYYFTETPGATTFPICHLIGG